jgi:hypothetical protein
MFIKPVCFFFKEKNLLPGVYPGVKRPEREADHSLPHSTEFKKEWSYTSTTLNLKENATPLHYKSQLNVLEGKIPVYTDLVRIIRYLKVGSIKCRINDR